jgi:hypothetical protein
MMNKLIVKEESSSAAHWLDAAKLSCGAEEVEDVKAIIRICVFLQYPNIPP